MKNMNKSRRFILMITLLALAIMLAACGSNSGGSTADPSPTTGDSNNSSENVNDAAGESLTLLNEGFLTLGVDATYPPLESFDENQQLVGFDIEFGEALAAEMGLEVKWVDTRFEGLISGLNASKFDAIISGITITEERAETVDFIPYFSSGQGMIAMKDAGLSLESEMDLAGLRVAVLTGSIQNVQLNDTIIPQLQAEGKDVNVSTYPTNPEAVQQLLKGTADVVFLDSPVAHELTKQFEQLEFVSPDLNPKNRGIVTRKGDTVMQEALNEAFQNLIANGTHAELLEKYGLNEAIE